MLFCVWLTILQKSSVKARKQAYSRVSTSVALVPSFALLHPTSTAAHCAECMDFSTDLYLVKGSINAWQRFAWKAHSTAAVVFTFIYLYRKKCLIAIRGSLRLFASSLVTFQKYPSFFLNSCDPSWYAATLFLSAPLPVPKTPYAGICLAIKVN